MTTVRREAATYYVKVYTPGGKGERLDVTDRITSFKYEDNEKIADKLSISIDNFDLSLFDNKLLRKGNLIETSWGYVTRMKQARECVIQSVKGSKLLTVEGLARSILMNKIARSRTFKNMSRSEVVRQIAKEYGYEDDRADIEVTGTPFPFIVQPKITDAQMIKNLARKEGFEFWIGYDGLHFHRRRTGAKPRKSYVYYFDQSAGDVLDFNVENDVTAVPGAVTVKGKDPITKKPIDVTANDASTKRDALAPVLEVVDPKTLTSHEVIQNNASSLQTTSATNAATAAREAKGQFVRAQQAVVLLTLQLVGDPDIEAKQVIEFTTGSKRLSGKYYVTVCTDSFLGGGSAYATELKVRADGSNHGAGTGTTTKSKVNTGSATGTDPNALQPIELVNAKTLETSTVYKKTSGGST